MKTFFGIDDLISQAGEWLGRSDWHTITQEQIDGFAALTGDLQWIHVDQERAIESPYGTTIAHGFLTLSLIPMFSKQIWSITGPNISINYGLDRVRFPAVVPHGTRIRAEAQLVRAERRESSTRATIRYTIHAEGRSKPACVADLVILLVD